MGLIEKRRLKQGVAIKRLDMPSEIQCNLNTANPSGQSEMGYVQDASRGLIVVFCHPRWLASPNIAVVSVGLRKLAREQLSSML